MLKAWFTRDELENWLQATWGFMKQIFPLLAGGVLVAGFLLGRPATKRSSRSATFNAGSVEIRSWAKFLSPLYRGRSCILPP